MAENKHYEIWRYQVLEEQQRFARQATKLKKCKTTFVA